MMKRAFLQPNSDSKRGLGFLFDEFKSKNIFLLTILLIFLLNPIVQAATYYVDTNGNDANAGSQTLPFKTIQKAVDVAVAGDTVLVNPGNYPEVVNSKNPGQDGKRIILQAKNISTDSIVTQDQKSTVRGFNIYHEYMTVQGFDITGLPDAYSAHIWVRKPYTGTNRGDHAQILNNTIRDGIWLNSDDFIFKSDDGGSPTITTAKGDFIAAGFRPGLSFSIGASDSAPIKNSGSMKKVIGVSAHKLTLSTALVDDGPVYAVMYVNSYGMTIDMDECLIQGNKLSNLAGNFLNVNGVHNIIENNILENQNGWDFIRFFGHDHIFRNNILRKGVAITGIGNHPDFVQTFADNGGESYNMLFEHNWIEGLDSQLGQLNSSSPAKGPYPTFHDYVFKNNVFANIGYNMNIGVPGVQFIGNTFYHTSYLLSGIIYGGALTRGDASRGLLKNNAFVGGGPQPGNGNTGFYSLSGSAIADEVFAFYLTNKDSTIAKSIYNNLIAQGYVLNGRILDKFTALTDASQMILDASLEGYRAGIWDVMQRTYALDQLTKSTFVADYNFVAGSRMDGYPAKSGFSGKEAHGVNGGDPLFVNVDDPAGPDGTPFTDDDGLIPLAGSPLCGKGEGDVALDIGAYPCKTMTGPYAYIQMDKNNGYDPVKIHLKGTSSSVPTGRTIVSYQWDFGDGSNASGEEVDHIFHEGDHTVSLTVTDSANQKNTAQAKVSITHSDFPDLYLYLKFDGDISDYSGKGMVSQLVGTAVYTAGRIGQAFSMDGTKTGSYAIVKHSDYLDGTPEMTVAFWAKKNVANTANVLLEKFISYRLNSTATGFTGTIYNSGGTRLDVSANGGLDTNWHHYAMTYDGSLVRLYLDGAMLASKPLSGTIAQNRDRNVYVGKDAWGNSLNGAIDEVRIYQRALSAEEILALSKTQELPNNGITGDVSGDERLTMHDAALLLRYITLGVRLSDPQKQANLEAQGDLNGDGKIDMADVVAIARKALGL